MMKGKKTYLVAALTLIYAAFGLYLKQLDVSAAMQLFLTALGLMGLRNGINKRD